jgi:hypothetical protein
MGRHLGLAVLRHGRVVLSAAALALALAGAVPTAAYADDTAPAPGPTQVPTVSPPSQQQIDDAKSALERLRTGGAATTPPVLTQVAGATLPEQAEARPPRLSDQDWWTIGAAALVLLVLSESTRIGVRRAKHRKEA